MKIVKIFQPKIVIFTAVKNRCMLHGRVFVMTFRGLCTILGFYVYVNDTFQMKKKNLWSKRKLMCTCIIRLSGQRIAM